MSDVVVTTTKRALYFGYGNGGHFLRLPGEHRTLEPKLLVPDFPWSIDLLDTGLLKNRKVPDYPDGRVYWTGGGIPLWIALFWWDRSGDQRPGSNSGFYVQGFCPSCAHLALDYACAQWPEVAARQLFPLVLQTLP